MYQTIGNLKSFYRVKIYSNWLKFVAEFLIFFVYCSIFNKKNSLKTCINFFKKRWAQVEIFKCE